MTVNIINKITVCNYNLTEINKLIGSYQQAIDQSGYFSGYSLAWKIFCTILNPFKTLDGLKRDLEQLNNDKNNKKIEIETRLKIFNRHYCQLVHVAKPENKEINKLFIKYTKVKNKLLECDAFKNVENTNHAHVVSNVLFYNGLKNKPFKDRVTFLGQIDQEIAKDKMTTNALVNQAKNRARTLFI